MVVASFHLARFPAALPRLARVPGDRRALRRVPGLRFGRLLGTGRGTRMTTSADLRRWALFAVWDDEDALERASHHRPYSGWAEATERFDVVLEPLGAHGSWDGVDPIAGAALPTGRPDGPVAALTRATVRWTKLPAFLRAVPGVDAVLPGTPGLLAAAGIGERPVGRQATFSLWRDADAVQAFAFVGDEHAEVVRRTRDEGWYGEGWFARFRPVRRSGTWDGRDPLA